MTAVLSHSTVVESQPTAAVEACGLCVAVWRAGGGGGGVQFTDSRVFHQRSVLGCHPATECKCNGDWSGFSFVGEGGG